ncbi:MAG: hypothetical protein ACLFVU_00590 [Phycisphaerae bacterium]
MCESARSQMDDKPVSVVIGSPLGRAEGLPSVELNLRMRQEANLPAYHPGNDTYRYCEQAGIMKLSRRLDEGKKQTITFPKVGSIRRADGELKLNTSSDSKLQVWYYVDYGPAVIENGVLMVTGLPARAKLPMETAVVAYSTAARWSRRSRRQNRCGR